MKATLLAALSIDTNTKPLRESVLFLTSCSLKIDFTDLYYFLGYDFFHLLMT